ncbi:MAG: hypothetical protein KIT31_23900 [Deltaproteobacteria bacterium]|nr:hypothetical protein [Deltaproteobacteria bacterium]
MQRLWIAVAAVAVAIALIWLVRRNASTDAPAVAVEAAVGSASASGPAGSGGGVSTAVSSSSSSAGGRRVTRLDPEAHRRLVERIAAARAARKTAAAAGATAQEAPATNDLARIGPQIKEGLEAAIPFLAECYTAGGDARPAAKTAAVNMTLVGDADVGMEIHAEEMLDESGAPLDPAIDACLRTTLESLALPPLDTGDAVRLMYSFRFD